MGEELRERERKDNMGTVFLPKKKNTHPFRVSRLSLSAFGHG